MTKKKSIRRDAKKPKGSNKKQKAKTEYQRERDAYKAMPKSRRHPVKPGKPQFVNHD